MRGPQQLHDFVIDELQLTLARRGELSWANHSGHRRFPVHGHWPDVVVVTEKENAADEVQTLYEVETAETIRDPATLDRWSALARLGFPLSIVVPDGDVPAVLAALEAWRVRAVVVPYAQSPRGILQFRLSSDAGSTDAPVGPRSA